MNKHLAQTFAAFACAGAIALGIAGCAGNTSASPDGGITVNATAKVSVVPDKCSFSVTVIEQGNSAAAAQRAANKPVKKIIKTLTDLGIAEKDIQTTYTDVSPVWDEEGMTDEYEARSMLEVSNVPIDQVGELMEAAANAGADEVDSLSYATTSYEESYEQALAQAIDDSRSKAEAIAQASGAKLGKIVSVTEGYQDMTFLAADAVPLAGAEEASDKGVEVSPGEVDVEAQVTVTYAIN